MRMVDGCWPKCSHLTQMREDIFRIGFDENG
jgi:hypothetical protein